MFATIIQLVLVVLIVYFAWNALVKKVPPPPPPKPPEKKQEPVIIYPPPAPPPPAPPPAPPAKPKFQPRDYLAWFGLFLIVIFILMAFTTPNNPSVIQLGSIITFPLKPLGFALFMFFLALFGGGIKNYGITKEGKNQLYWGFFVLAFFSLPFVAGWLSQQGELTALNAMQVANREKVGAIVLLGQQTTTLNLLNPNQIQLAEASDRLLQTAQVYKRQRSLGSNPFIVVSAGPRAELLSDDPKQVNLIEARDIAKILVQLGIPREAIILEPTGVDIRTSALAVRNMVRDGIISKRVILVSSALNIQRARQAFAQVGIETIPVPAGFYSFQAGTIPKIMVDVSPPGACEDTVKIAIRDLRQLKLSDFIANVDSLLVSSRIINEFWTWVYYLLRGWLAPTVDAVPQGTYIKC